jgi:hypothetical protein
MKSLVLNQQNIAVLGNKIRIEIPISALRSFVAGKKKIKVQDELINKKVRHRVFEEAKGSWKRHKIDPVKYQQKIREEWN